MKIIHKFLLVFFAVTLLFLAFGFISARKGREILKDTIGKSSVILVHEALDKIDRSLFSRIEEMQVFTKSIAFQTVITNSNETFAKKDDISNYIDEIDLEWTFSSGESLSPDMRRIMSTDLSAELRERIEFYERKYGYRVFAEIFVTNRYGANVGQSGKTSDYRQDDEEWWQIARRDGLYMSDIGYDESSGVYSLEICLRIDDSDGKFLGVMKSVFNVVELFNLVEELSSTHDKGSYKNRFSGMEEHKTMEFLLFTERGKIIASANKSDFLKSIPNILMSYMQTHNHSYFIIDDYGSDAGGKLFALDRSEGYRDFKGFGWNLVVIHGTEEIFRPADRLWNFLMFMLVAVILTAGLLGFVITRSIASPLMKLKRKMLEVSEGRLDVKIDLKSNDEIGDLADSFQDMLRHINNSTTSIKNLNEEIVEREKIEEQLLRNKEELEITYNNLINTQSQMLQGEKMASIGQLAAGVAHEINNPMGFITSNLGSLRKYVDKFIRFIDSQSEMLASLGAGNRIKEVRKKQNIDFIIGDTNSLLEDSLDGAIRVTEIVRNLIGFSRLDAGKFTETNINECLDVTLKIVWNELKYKCTLHKEYGEVPLTFCIAQELNQVFMNILVNASHSIDDRGDITIRTRAKAGFINVSITDTGCGIAEDTIERIFDPFYTTKEVGKGTGLGLSICYDIIKKHEGELTVESEPGKGTTFTVSLPVKEREL